MFLALMVFIGDRWDPVVSLAVQACSNLGTIQNVRQKLVESGYLSIGENFKAVSDTIDHSTAGR